jgi:hypothetical protein
MLKGETRRRGRGTRAFECILVRASRSAVFTAHLTFCAAPFNSFKPAIASRVISSKYYSTLGAVNLEN